MLAAGLAKQPFVLLFLVVAAGYALGRLKVRGIGLGATASTLIIALATSLIAALRGTTFALPEFASTLFFNLFMFAVGMKVGPQFLSGLRRDAKRFLLLGLLVPVLALGAIFVVRAIFHPAPGIIPGVFAGANTATPGFGAAQTAYASGAGHLTAGVTVAEAASSLSTAFAFSYCISMVLFIVLMKVPDMFGANTARAAAEYERSIKGGGAPLPGVADEFFGTVPAAPVTVRTYEIEAPELLGQPLGELRRKYPLVSVERISRRGRLIDPRDDTVLERRDTVALFGPIARLAVAGGRIGTEVYERVVRDVGLQTVDVIVHKGVASGRSLGDLAADVGHGLFLNAMFRGGDEIPHGPETIIRKGDVLRVTGSAWRVKILEQETGRVIRPSLSTDIVTLALGLTAGALIGMITIPIGQIRLAFGSAVGLLLVGIGLSTLRTRHPRFGGPYPEPARRLIEDLGLNVFVAIVGLNSGAGVIQTIKQGSIAPILIGTLIVGFVPALIAWVVGRRALRMNIALLLGAVAGGRCNSAGMQAAQESTQSNVPALSYPVTFAISNVVLTFMSYVMAMVG
ncbi:MAG TPA: TrkA C-terminal domain-containing protein [Polyangia bacterium]